MPPTCASTYTCWRTGSPAGPLPVTSNPQASWPSARGRTTRPWGVTWVSVVPATVSSSRKSCPGGALRDLRSGRGAEVAEDATRCRGHGAAPVCVLGVHDVLGAQHGHLVEGLLQADRVVALRRHDVDHLEVRRVDVVPLRVGTEVSERDLSGSPGANGLVEVAGQLRRLRRRPAMSTECGSPVGGVGSSAWTGVVTASAPPIREGRRARWLPGVWVACSRWASPVLAAPRLRAPAQPSGASGGPTRASDGESSPRRKLARRRFSTRAGGSSQPVRTAWAASWKRVRASASRIRRWSRRCTKRAPCRAAGDVDIVKPRSSSARIARSTWSGDASAAVGEPSTSAGVT